MPEPLPLVRPYTTDDLDHVLALDTSFEYEQIYQVSRDGDSFIVATSQVVPPRSKSYDLEAEVVAAEWDDAYVAVASGEIVGFTATQFAAWHRRQGIQHLYVAPHWRRRGVARSLLGAVLARAIENGAVEVWLETSNVNTPAIEAYKRMGFQLCGLDLSFYRGTPEKDEVGFLMSRDMES